MLVLNGPVEYQWYNDGGLISGAVNAEYTVVDAAAAAQDYWVVVTNSADCSDNSPISNKLSVTVNETPTFSVSNPSAQCGGTYDLSTAVTGLTSGATLAYHDHATNNSSVSKDIYSYRNE